MRLSRFGYRAGVISSTTYEEAPAKFGPWLRQRTRWFKGWMQTWLVHMREPRRLPRELGLPGFLSCQLIVGGNVLAALVHPLFMGSLIYSVASGAPMWRGDSVALAILAALYGTTIVIGYLTSAFLGWLGLARRGLQATSWVLLLTPLHWLMLSLAAWRPLYQLIRPMPGRRPSTGWRRAPSSPTARRGRCSSWNVISAILQDRARWRTARPRAVPNECHFRCPPIKTGLATRFQEDLRAQLD